MRILIVTRNLPPLVGGMERLNWHMAEELAKVADVRVVGPEGSAALAPRGVAVREAPLEPLRRFLWRARGLARREALSWQPDLVLAGSGLTAPLVRSAARACGVRYAVYVHGLDVAVRNPVYRLLWLPSIRQADRVIANSQATLDLCRHIGVDPKRIGIVHPGVDLPHDEPLSPRERGRGEGTNTRNLPESAPPAGSSFRTPCGGDVGSVSPVQPSRPATTVRDRHDLGAGPLLLSVGRLSARKGLREFVSQALPRIVAAYPGAMLLIVGDAPAQALHAEPQTPEAIRVEAERKGLGGHLKFLGVITDYAELGKVYRAADVHIFPVREIAGDPEGFGMVAVEAAAHGLPTVGFATGGVVDAVAVGKSGRLVPPNDYVAFADAVVASLADREALRQSCIDFARQFAWPTFGAQIAQQLDVA